MKVRVTKSFIDRYTKEAYKVGAELELTDKRFAEINAVSSGLVEAIGEAPEAPKKAVTSKKKSTKTKED